MANGLAVSLGMADITMTWFRFSCLVADPRHSGRGEGRGKGRVAGAWGSKAFHWKGTLAGVAGPAGLVEKWLVFLAPPLPLRLPFLLRLFPRGGRNLLAAL